MEVWREWEPTLIRVLKTVEKSFVTSMTGTIQLFLLYICTLQSLTLSGVWWKSGKNLWQISIALSWLIIIYAGLSIPLSRTYMYCVICFRYIFSSNEKFADIYRKSRILIWIVRINEFQEDSLYPDRNIYIHIYLLWWHISVPGIWQWSCHYLF